MTLRGKKVMPECVCTENGWIIGGVWGRDILHSPVIFMSHRTPWGGETASWYICATCIPHVFIMEDARKVFVQEFGWGRRL